MCSGTLCIAADCFDSGIGSHKTSHLTNPLGNGISLLWFLVCIGADYIEPEGYRFVDVVLSPCFVVSSDCRLLCRKLAVKRKVKYSAQTLNCPLRRVE